MGGGILPIAKYKNKIYFLFGLEHEEQLWSDFGGGKYKNETPYQTAIREGYEELNGIFGSKTSLRELVSKNLLLKIEYQDKSVYTSFLFEIPYNEALPYFFNVQHDFIEENIPDIINKNGFFEKSKIQWMSFADIKKNRNNFRIFYRNIIDNILLNDKVIINLLL
jgi:8-oxo-dGTP pyrophosphatase MutT (NUDIX family)